MVMRELKKFLKINRTVNIEIVNNTEKAIRYASRIEGITAERLLLAAPMKQRQPLSLAPKTPLNIWFWDEKAVYVFRAYFLERVADSVPKIAVTYPQMVKRVQKREFVRVGLELEVLLSYYNPLGEEEAFYCGTRDISGGGMMLVLSTYVPLNKGCKIQAQFFLENCALNISGIIVWNEWELDLKGIERNLIGVQFTNITEKDREIIIKTVFQRQIELKREGELDF